MKRLSAALVLLLLPSAAFAFDAGVTFADAERESIEADYLVEVVGGDAYSDDYGGVGIGNRHADVTLAVVALPFVQWAQVRRVAHAAAKDAAAIVTTTVRGQ